MGAPPVRYVHTSDGYDVATFVAGSGPTLIRTPVLFNHISRQWAPDILGPGFDALADRLRFVLYDSRGQGLSTRGLPESMSFDDLLLDLEAVVDDIAPGPFYLTGWSFSASIAIRYAADHPERVKGLILLEYWDFSTRSDAMIRLAEEDWRYFVETTAHTSWTPFDPERIKPILYDSNSQADHFRQAQALRTASGAALLAQVEVPTLFIAHRIGTRPAAAEQTATRWASSMPNANLLLIDDPAWFGKVQDGVPEVPSAVVAFVEGVEQKSHTRNPRLEVDLHLLSSRELEVLRLLAMGRSNQQIADELVISPSTVAHHVTSILTKTESANRAQATSYAHRHDLL